MNTTMYYHRPIIHPYIPNEEVAITKKLLRKWSQFVNSNIGITNTYKMKVSLQFSNVEPSFNQDNEIYKNWHLSISWTDIFYNQNNEYMSSKAYSKKVYIGRYVGGVYESNEKRHTFKAAIESIENLHSGHFSKIKDLGKLGNYQNLQTLIASIQSSTASWKMDEMPRLIAATERASLKKMAAVGATKTVKPSAL